MALNDSLYPKVCFCSSGQSEEYVDAILENWKKEDLIPDKPVFSIDFFNLPKNLFEEVIPQIKNCDFVVFICTKEDIQKIKTEDSQNQFLLREKLFFVLGLLIGNIGQKRFFYYKPIGETFMLLDEIEDVIHGLISNQEDIIQSVRVGSNKIARKMHSMGKRDPLKLIDDPDDLKVVYTHYKIKILNKEGDAEIERILTLRAQKDNVNCRQHQIYCDTHSASYNEVNIEAFNAENQLLRVKKVDDLPNRKEFLVLFRENLSKGEEITYRYKLNWPGMFPPNDSAFMLKVTAEKTEFSLILREDWDLQFIEAVNKRLSGASSNEKPDFKKNHESQSGHWINRKYELKATNNNLLDNQIKWLWE